MVWPEDLSVQEFTADLYCICLNIPQFNTDADAVQIFDKFWDTQYAPIHDILSIVYTFLNIFVYSYFSTFS